MNAPLIAPNVPRVMRLRVDDFLVLNDAGAFQDYAKVELIEGEIFSMNAQYSRHALTKSRLAVLLSLALRDKAMTIEAIIELAVRLSDDSMPEPDIVLTCYKGDGPVPLDTLALVVEVADTTLDFDLGRKRALYARHGVPEYCVVDVEGRTVHQHWSPDGDSYVQSRTLAFGEPLVAATIDGLSVPTATLG